MQADINQQSMPDIQEPSRDKSQFLMSLFLCLLSALILASLYIGLPAGLLAFIALIPFFHGLFSADKKDSFLLGFLWGLAFFAPVLWWIAPTIFTYGKLPLWAAWLVFALLACYLAMYPALWARLARKLVRDWRYMSVIDIMALASMWMLMEVAKAYILSGFPWASLAYSLCKYPLLIQSADIWGPYGLGFIIVVFNLILWQLMLPRRHQSLREGAGKRLIWSMALLCCLASALLFYGRHCLYMTDRGTARVAAIQGSFDQSVKWDPAYRRATLSRYSDLTRQAKAEFPDLMLAVWPETAIPFYFQEDSDFRNQVTSLAQKFEISILLGSPSYFYDVSGHLHYRNSAFLVGPDGDIRGRYDKQHLVPFGEYMPWGRLTSWAKGLLPTAGNFTPGTSSAPLNSNPFRIGVMICFESIFPRIARKEVAENANLLAVITNDAWFGKTSAPWQHADMAIFRAVETRRWIVRAANTGVSRIISPTGQVISQTGIFQPGFITGRVSLNNRQTFFVVHGPYWFYALNLLFILSGIFLNMEAKKRENNE